MISKTAIIRNARIGEGTDIWHYANIYGCDIGKDTCIGSYVEVTSGAKIGDRVIVSSHSFICDLVKIANDVFIGHGVMTINDLYPPSKKRTGVANWKGTYIGEGATIGTNATILPVRIGKGAIIGAGSVVVKDVGDYEVVVGNPARFVRRTR